MLGLKQERPFSWWLIRQSDGTWRISSVRPHVPTSPDVPDNRLAVNSLRYFEPSALRPSVSAVKVRLSFEIVHVVVVATLPFTLSIDVHLFGNSCLSAHDP